MISVICCIYNTRQYLTRCIESILHQSFRHFELILIDDGSTDGSGVIADRYANSDSRVRVMHQGNVGLAESRNRGIRLAKYDLIYFVDSDDYINIGTLDLLYSIMQKENADISIGRVILDHSHTIRCHRNVYDSTLVRSYRTFTNIEALHVLVDAVKRNYRDQEFLPLCATWNKIFRKSLFDNVIFPPDRVHEDNSTAHRLLYAAQKIVLADAVTYSWTRRHSSLSSGNLYDLDMVAAFEDRVQFFTETNLTEFLPLSYCRYEAILYSAYLKLKYPELIERMKQMELVDLDYKVPQDIQKYRTIGLYCPELIKTNGITTWIYNFCNGLKDKFSIVVYANTTSNHIRAKFRNLVPLVKLEADHVYNCDVLLVNSLSSPPDNIKCDLTYTVLHCDFSACHNRIEGQFDASRKYIAVSEYAAQRMKDRFGIECDYVEGLFLQAKPSIKNVLHLVSATRFNREKGFDDFIKLASWLSQNGVLFEWRIYSDYSTIPVNIGPSMIVLPAVDNSALLSFMADADYVVQLSHSEGFCFVVHESLLVGTPVIVSDIPIFRKYIQDGVNGYILPNDVENFDVVRLKHLPKSFVYETHFDDMKKKWINILGEQR